MVSQWKLTAEELPPEGTTVLTMGENGTEQALTRKGRLWFFPDYSMYVYYTPRYWRPITDLASGRKEA